MHIPNPSDYHRFHTAMQAIESGRGMADGIAMMIHLSWNALPLPLRGWAARYLESKFNTSVERDDDHEATGTTSTVP